MKWFLFLALMVWGAWAFTRFTANEPMPIDEPIAAEESFFPEDKTDRYLLFACLGGAVLLGFCIPNRR